MLPSRPAVQINKNGTERKDMEGYGRISEQQLTPEVYLLVLPCVALCARPLSSCPQPRYVRAAVAAQLHRDFSVLTWFTWFRQSSIAFAEGFCRISGGRHVGVLLCRHFPDQKRLVPRAQVSQVSTCKQCGTCNGSGKACAEWQPT